MAAEKKGYLPIDDLVAKLDAESVVRQLAPDVEIHRAGKEIRLRCFLACGKQSPTGERTLCINTEHPAKFFKCHNQYGDGCTGMSGNFVSLVSLATGGTDRPKGDEFKRVRDLIRRLAEGESISVDSQPAIPDKPTPHKEIDPLCVNAPLAEHENERARSVADLWKKLTLDESLMTPAASRYKRERPFLTDEARALFHFGWLGRDAGGDRSGGTMRGKWVYAIKNAVGQIIGYAGRDPEYEANHAAWLKSGRQGDDAVKWRFPKTFHRGVELYGSDLLEPEHSGDTFQRIALPVVEGPNDVIALRVLHNIPSVGLLSNQATEHQIARIAEIAHQVAGGLATLLLDCDEQGDKGAAALAADLSKHCRVQRAWAMDMHGGKFKGVQPEQLNAKDVEFLMNYLARSRS